MRSRLPRQPRLSLPPPLLRRGPRSLSLPHSPRAPRRSLAVARVLGGRSSLGIGTKLTVGFGALVGLTLLVVALAILAGRDATRDIEVSEAVRAPASLAAAHAQEALLRMQLHLRGYLVLSDRDDITQYDAARQAFETRLASLQRLAAGWDAQERPARAGR